MLALDAVAAISTSRTNVAAAKVGVAGRRNANNRKARRPDTHGP